MGKNLNEATSTSGGSGGSYVAPLQPGIRYFKKNVMGPFTEPVSKYKSPDLEYDSYDNKMERSKKQIGKEEKMAKKVYNYIKNHPNATFSDVEGNPINRFPGKNTKIVPIKEWIELDKINLNEDLAVWFGTKKKPKGSKQPKGPWVNICRKVDGKHPPCGRPEASDKGYPKCRAAGVASKMSASQKKSACQQKRKAEKTHSKSGTGNKPKMTHYKPRNEELSTIIRRVIRENTNQVSSK